MKDKKKRLGEGEKTAEKRRRVEIEDVPLHRSYGVTKTVNPALRAIGNFLAKALTLFLLAFELAIILIFTFLLAFYTDVLVATALFTVLFSIFFYNATKLLRRRARFIRKLKRFCKKNGYEIEFHRSFLKGFYWAKGERVDFTLKAGKRTYCVKLATSKRYLSSFTFISKSEMKYTRIARRNIFTTIFDFKDKTHSVPIAFPKEIDDNDKNIVKAILINPAVVSMQKRGSDGVIIPTGSGEKLFGYTIYTASGFMESVKRIEEEEK